MGNHYHIIIRTPLGNLNEAMHYLGYNYTKHINQELKRSGPVFESRYLPILMNNEKYLLRGARYIHRNPIEAHMIAYLKDYKWSSYPGYLDKSVAPGWMFRNEVLKRFEKLNYHDDFEGFTKNGKDEELSTFFNNLRYQSTLIDHNDTEKLIASIDEQRLPQEYFDNKNTIKLYRPPNINLIIDITAQYFEIKIYQLCCRRTFKAFRIPRNTAIHLCKHLGKASLRAIGIKMGDITPTAISNNLARNTNNPSVLKHIEPIISLKPLLSTI